MGAWRSVSAAGVRIMAGGPGSRWRARMLRTTSAEWTPCAIASAQAASTAGSPSVRTALRMSTIGRLSLRIDPVHLAGFDERGDDRPMLAAAVGAGER